MSFTILICLGIGALVNQVRICNQGWIYAAAWESRYSPKLFEPALHLYPILVQEPEGPAFGFYIQVDIKHYVHPTRGPDAGTRLVVSSPWYRSFDDLSEYIEWDELSELEQSAVLEQVSTGTALHRWIYGGADFEFDGVSSFTSNPNPCPVVFADLFQGGSFGAVAGVAVWALLVSTSFSVRRIVRNRRRRLGKCERCAYPLIDGFCPECSWKSAD
ncbi:MAG: hypothetical protein KC996_00380 [Phycisphaerales bacterium]|nr:hypothetical protein [Phycisphaerales bacterium]